MNIEENKLKFQCNTMINIETTVSMAEYQLSFKFIYFSKKNSNVNWSENIRICVDRTKYV